MYSRLKRLAIIGSLYGLSCSSNPAPRSSEDANNGVQETVHVSHEEETVVTTRREVVSERSTERTVGNRTERNTQRTTDSSERRLRTVDRQEGTVNASARNLTLDLEGLVAGISHARYRKNMENDNTYLDLSFTYNGTNFVASLVDFSDDMIGEEGDHVCDYFLLSLHRGANGTYFMRVNFSDHDESLDLRQPAHTASLDHYVPVGNVVYRINFNPDLSNADIMRLVDAARSRVESYGYH